MQHYMHVARRPWKALAVSAAAAVAAATLAQSLPDARLERCVQLQHQQNVGREMDWAARKS